MRVLIVTPDINGPIRNGGIGTAFAALADWAAGESNLQVTVAYALGSYSENGPIEKWIDHYAQHKIKFIPIDDNAVAPLPVLDTPRYQRLSWIVHTWLQRTQSHWDVVIFPEWMGLAYYALLAKRQGLHYAGLPIIVNTHSPEAWAMAGNRILPSSLDDINRDFLERECVRMADWVISPSKYMLEWMRSYHWALPQEQQCRVIPNLMPLNSTVSHALEPVRQVQRIVFFGRLEHRKGLKLFCDAIDRLDADERKRLGRIVFLGKAVAHHDFQSRTYIANRVKAWEIPVEILTDKNRDQAIAELRAPGTVAVIPSLMENSPYTVLECLREGIVFLAAKVGGIPEQVDADDHEDHLFDINPRALSEKLRAIGLRGLTMARGAWTEDSTRAQWTALLEEVLATAAAPAKQSDAPLVSVCLVHYNRPHLLRQALDSLRAQTYRNLEVVLIDDGSPSAEAQAFLQSLQSEFDSRNWQIVRQPNSYLGAARNNAAAHARGSYLLFMDDDNVALPHMVETFVCAAMHSGADVLTSVMAPFSEETPPPTPARLWIVLGGALGIGLFRNSFGDANALWRKEAFEKVGGYTTDYGVGHEDWELFADAMLSGLRLELIPEPLYWYRVNPNSMLRAGDHWVDHARSVRPFLRHNPHGLGMALAYALYSQRMHETRQLSVIGGGLSIPSGRTLVKAVRYSLDPSLRAQFMGAWRSQGLLAAIRRALLKASL